MSQPSGNKIIYQSVQQQNSWEYLMLEVWIILTTFIDWRYMWLDYDRVEGNEKDLKMKRTV